MMPLKTHLQNWLGIRDYDKELGTAVETYRKEATIEFERIVKQMQPVACINCNKLLIAGRDPVYTDSKGQKFCSHDCIDKFADKSTVKPKKGKK